MKVSFHLNEMNNKEKEVKENDKKNTKDKENLSREKSNCNIKF